MISQLVQAPSAHPDPHNKHDFTNMLDFTQTWLYQPLYHLLNLTQPLLLSAVAETEPRLFLERAATWHFPENPLLLSIF